MEDRHLVHLVEYLNSSLGHTEENGEIAIITIRPDRGSFRPHNVALPIAQAKRLLTDLQRLFAPATLLLLCPPDWLFDSRRGDQGATCPTA